MKYPGSLSKPNSEEEFIFHATDKKGHHATLSKLAIPPEMDQAISQIIEQSHFEYRTKADIVRDALYHRLAWLCDHYDLGFGEKLRRVKSIDSILAEEDSRIKYEEQMARLAGIIGATGDSPDEQRRVVNSVAQEIYQMPEGYWKKRYLDYLKKHYGHLVEPWSMDKTEED